ncbi:hypothetical protein MHK_010788 [Candidatus Magnetomorum sp. HK-1]|nr:hypothetical protein MHK_010788 [Candidatus Magnetomorum sp. HK-1]
MSRNTSYNFDRLEFQFGKWPAFDVTEQKSIICNTPKKTFGKWPAFDVTELCKIELSKEFAEVWKMAGF